jgi:hypothetical protein
MHTFEFLIGALAMYRDLLHIQSILNSLDKQYNYIEKDIINNQNPKSVAQGEEQLEELKIKIDKYQQEYLRVLQQQAPQLTFIEADAQAVIDIIGEEITKIQSNVQAYSDDVINNVRAIQEKLDEPGVAAAVKIKPVITLLPPGIGFAIEGELDMQNSSRRIFSFISRMIRGSQPKK